MPDRIERFDPSLGVGFVGRGEVADEGAGCGFASPALEFGDEDAVVKSGHGLGEKLGRSLGGA